MRVSVRSGDTVSEKPSVRVTVKLPSGVWRDGGTVVRGERGHGGAGIESSR